MVSLKDNDANIYEKLQGKWVLTGVSYTGETMTSVVKIIGASNEDEGDYNNTLYLTGMAMSSSTARLSTTTMRQPSRAMWHSTT